ncbi:thrombospondin type-1 domain-containing protein 1 isoform X1 [Podarcis raffonei]|uniref:thrombospondin type-1 domain-containing protein 1 isoform X1 n=1 Tax=Podarcis raffonei TaxID=65483 RepID=UPI002329172C|nr:thrombospondin type-1 domain-containing protein 1 isoform X1 [Podarcis raffonei]XP_053236507.1 thrombospondin type-1 domain-containing protein 1 isoform X1 [Podarcis raffonei]
MKQMLKDFSNLLLVVLCDYVLGAVEYLLLEQATHVALSNGTVSVSFQNYYDSNVTLKNGSILLIDASTNQTVTRKQLLQNQDQDIVVFECFHFKSAGNYWFRMAPENQWNGEKTPLSVIWPVFHFDLRRTSEAVESSLQLRLFTDEYLCPVNKTVVSLDVILTSRFYELGKQISNETGGLRTSKELSLARSQWVTLDCRLVGQEAYMTVFLKSAETKSVIASEGPIDLVHRFGYKLVVSGEVTCESSVVVSVIPPPCTSPGGNVAVFKDLGPSGQRALRLQESVVSPKDGQIEFNCTLFDEGANKYCFEFSLLHRDNAPPRARECALIQRNVGSWGLWQAWSPCSVTCGDGTRERYRECPASFPFSIKQGCAGRQQETSLCSLEECSTTKPVPITPLYPSEDGQKANNNLVTVTGISLCLSIIFATVLIALWRKLCRTQKCSTPVRCDPTHSPSFRKNSDEENICQDERQQRESFSEGEVACSLSGEPPDMPLSSRRSLYFAPEGGGGGASASESFESTAQKIIPPIFSYRLAQQQLKEMKKKGLTETTKVYRVSQNPLTDTVLNSSVSPENQEAAAGSKFRIKSPFLEQPPGHPISLGDKHCSRADFTLPQASPTLSPCQSLIRRTHPRYLENKGEPSERVCPRSSQFRRTASFHETRKAKPFRKRSMSTLTPCQTHLYRGRARTWSRVPEGEHRPKSKSTSESIEEFELYYNTPLTTESMAYGTHNPHKWEPPGKKIDWVTRRQPVAQELCVDRSEQKRNLRGPSLGRVDAWKNECAVVALKDMHQRGGTLSPTQYRTSKCQSFPSDPEYHFYDNTSFGLAELEQQTIDLPGYFASDEGGGINTLSIDHLVL